MNWLTEWTIEQWIAVLAIAGSTLGWTIASGVRAFTYRREQQQREWLRLYELLKILYNKDYEHGHWAQLAAVNEMKTLTRNRGAVSRLAVAIREFWAQGDSHPRIIEELDRLLRNKS